MSEDNQARAAGAAIYVEATGVLVQHCRDNSAPVVLICGYHGTEKTRLIREAARANDLVLREARADETAGRMLQRRLQVLSAGQGRTVHQAADLLQEACRSQLQGRGHVLVQNIDLLDEDSLQVLDLLARRGQAGIFMTASAPSRLGYRYARILGSSRGLQVSLSPLSAEEVQRRLGEMLEAPPTSGLCDYLLRCSAGVPHTLERVVGVGQDEGWIGTLGSRSVIMRPPIWMDSQHAASFRNEVKEVLGVEALGLLDLVAIEEDYSLPHLLSIGDDAVFMLEEAGLLGIENGKVRIARPAHRHLLVRGSSKSGVQGEPSPEKTLISRLAGEEVDSSQASDAAEELLQRGLLEQARFVVAALPPGDARGEEIEACASVLKGAPRRALHRLSKGNSAESAEPGENLTVALAGFLESVLLRNHVPGAAQCELFGEIVRHLDMLEDFHAQTYLDLVPETVSQQRWAEYKRIWDERREETTYAGEPDLPLLALATGLALDAYAAAVADHRQRAYAAIDLFAQLPAESIPAVGMDWVLDHIGLARILVSPEEEIYPAEWLAGEAPERALLRTTSSETILLFQSLVRGEPIDVLRDRLEGIWAQFEGGLARGLVTRKLLEAFDFVVEGDRSEELIGPAGMIVPQIGGAFHDPWVDALLVTGQLLHCPPDELPQDPKAVFAGKADARGVRRLIIRCVILRRGADLPHGVLESLISMGQESGVEAEVLAYAWGVMGDAEQETSSALERLREVYPTFQIAKPSARSSAVALTNLRADRLRLLSDREKQIAERIIAGTTAMQTADIFGISVRTVQTHVRNVYRKLAVSSRTELRAELLSGLEVRP